MNHSQLDSTKLVLIKQLVFFDEEMVDFLNTYFPDNNRERKSVEQVLGTYMNTLESILAQFDDKSLCSIVLIGSKVKFKNLDSNQENEVTIVFPQQTDPDNMQISFLSPIGLNLLLATKNETRAIKTPTSIIRANVEKIEFINQQQITRQYF